MIDGHVHVWAIDPVRYPWQQTLAHVPIPTAPATAESLLAEMDRAGVSHAVLVQTSVYGWNNDYLCDAIERHPGRFIGVCLVDPRAPDAGERLRYWCAERGCDGLRINIIGHREVDWLLAEDRAGLWDAARALGISVALQMRPDQAGIVEQLATRQPQVRFVADYLGGEAFRDGSGIAAVERLGRLPNLWYKVQSLGQDSREPYPFRDLWPLYERAVAAFGAHRVVFGTDFPHMLPACRYGDAIRWLDELPFLSSADRALIGDGNARALWRIP